jgi:hypothetical protein
LLVTIPFEAPTDQTIEQLLGDVEAGLLELMMKVLEIRKLARQNRPQSRTRYDRVILAILTESYPERLTFWSLHARLNEKGYDPSQRTVLRYLKSLTLRGQIDKRQDGASKGYGLVVLSEEEEAGNDRPGPQRDEEQRQPQMPTAVMQRARQEHQTHQNGCGNGKAKMNGKAAL